MEYMTSTSPYPPNNINDPSSSTSVPLIPLQHQQWPLQISPVPTTGTGLEGKTKQKTHKKKKMKEGGVRRNLG